MNKIAPAFVKAKKAFSPALKSNVNPHFKSKYADLATCLEAVNDALLDNGIALMQMTHEDPSGVTVETVFIHESGEQMHGGKLHVPAAKLDPQGFGSALSYARRYSLMAACGIAAEDDDGQAAVAAQRRQQRDGWLRAQFAKIDAAKNGAELKKAVADAIAVAEQESDQDAINQIKSKAQAKVEAARGPVIAVRSGIGEDLPEDVKTFLRDLAEEVSGFVKEGNVGDAIERIDCENLDGDQRTYLENHMDAKTRAALKQPKVAA